MTKIQQVVFLIVEMTVNMVYAYHPENVVVLRITRERIHLVFQFVGGIMFCLLENILNFCFRGCGFYGKCIEPDVCGCGLDKQKCINGNCNSRGKCVCNSENGLMRYIDSCVTHDNLTRIVTNPNAQARYNHELLNEFNNHIGKYFQFGKK